MNLDHVAKVAKAVLYEGYILYPYRPSSVKNRQRWSFGGVFPRLYADHEPSEPWRMQTQCLLIGGPGTAIDIRVQFLQLVARDIEVSGKRTASLDVDGQRHIAWEEAIEREVTLSVPALGQLLHDKQAVCFSYQGAQEREIIRTKAGHVAGELVRTKQDLGGTIRIAAQRMPEQVYRLSICVENESPISEAESVVRDIAQRRAFVSTHTILGLTDGEFVSLMDPPGALRDEASACENIGTWPVLAGPEAQRRMMLSSPIILYDYPQVAPESPGNLFDSTEIDEILSLRILSLTDEEKREMAAASEQARALLQRTESLTPEAWGRLHGALRRPNRDATALKPGDRVRLQPRRRADIMDVVLKDKIGIVEAIERDFEDRIHVAVTILDDPGRDFGLDRMPGHRFFFAQDEVERLPPETAA
jgi:hypothetical protein